MNTTMADPIEGSNGMDILNIAALPAVLPLPMPPLRCRRLQRHALAKLPTLLPSWPSPPRCRCAGATAAAAVAFVFIVIVVAVIVTVSVAIDAAAFG